MKFSSVFKNIDILGQRVYLTHESKQMYKTSLGATFSSFFFIGMLTYFLILASNVWQEKIKNIITITGYLDPNLDSSVMEFTKNNF